MAKSRIEVIDESESGRNKRFLDTKTGKEMSRSEFVAKIRQEIYQDYHVRKINGTDTPVSNPDGKGNNNLG